MKKKISKITAGVIGIIMGSAVIFSQPNYNIDITEKIATTQNTDYSTETTTTEQPNVDTADASIEETKIANTTYIN